MFVADLHNDLVQRMMIGEDVTKNTSSGHRNKQKKSKKRSRNIKKGK